MERAGTYAIPPTTKSQDWDNRAGPFNTIGFCNGIPDKISCGPMVNTSTLPYIVYRTTCIRDHHRAGTGIYPSPGFKDGGITESKLNSPRSVISGFGGRNVIVADTGNNRIREVDTVTKTIKTIAGNGSTFDNGDGSQAISAGIFHPNFLIYDSEGNLYISTERGYIRKIDPNGVISRWAGKTSAEGGLFVDQAPAEDILLNNPQGMVIDEVNKYLYVADYGHHRVMQIDMLTKVAKVVAGSGSCLQGSQIGDRGPALLASLCNPATLGLDEKQNLLIHDLNHDRVRRVVFQNSEVGFLSFAPNNKDNSNLLRQIMAHLNASIEVVISRILTKVESKRT